MDLEKTAIERLKLASEMSLTYYEQPLVVTYSGGKDSDVCLSLAKRAGIPFEVQHNHTTADAPETVHYTRKVFHDLECAGVKCNITYPYYKGQRVSLWTLMPQKLIPPTQIQRYCCDVLKERSCNNRMIVTGVRWAESSKRRVSRGIYETLGKSKASKIILNNDNDDTRRLFENCQLKAKRVCNPIVDWKDRDVWGYLNAEGLSANPLYQCGFDRVGCIGCPMGGRKRYSEFRRYPKYKEMYIRAFDRIVLARNAAGKDNRSNWTSGYAMFQWWMYENPDQIILDGWEDDI